MELVTHDQGSRHQPGPGAPTVTVVFGGSEQGPDVGIARVRIPAGTGMPAHRHSGSDVILTTMTGMVRISKDDQRVEVHPGDSVLITKDESVALTNPGDSPAEVLVAAGPADFIATIRTWPAPTTS